MRTTTETTRTIDLGHDQMMVFDGGRDGRVRVLFGATWLTQEGEPGDAVLHAGSELALSAGRTVIEALGQTRLQIVERTGVLVQLTAFLRQAWRSVRQHVTRLQLGPVMFQRGA